MAPNQEIDVSNVMRDRLEFDAGQGLLEGALVYKIQRRQHSESGEFVQDESKSIQLLVAWRVEHTKGLHVRALLVEHDKELDEDKLRKLYRKYWHLLKTRVDSIRINWLLDDVTMLTTTVKAMNGGYEWDIFISEGIRDNVKRLLWINIERQVAIMLVIFLMLMCSASLTIHETIGATVYNQYPDIELVSPVYFCDGGTYNEYFVERTDTSVMMRISLRLGLLDKLPGGILMYKVQRKRNAKSDHQPSTDTASTEVIEDTLKMMRLLVAWKIGSFGEPGVYITLVEHSNELVLNEDKLAQLYNKINDTPSEECDWVFRYCSFSKSTWLMCDNTIMVARYEAAQKESLESKIIISKGVKSKYAESVLWIDSERQVSLSAIIYIF
jgi:hypothetical protein